MKNIAEYEAMGNELTTSLGFENKTVILYWKAFEEKRFLACELHYKVYKTKCKKQGLTKSTSNSIIIVQ